MNNSCYYKVYLPFSKKSIHFRELKTQDQLDIEKINLYYPSTIDYYIEYHQNFLKVLNKCVENFDDLLNCDIVDYILFCTKLRIVSIGDVLELNIKSEDPKVKSAKIVINLQDFLQNFLNLTENSLVTKEIEYKEKNLKIELGWPSLKSVKDFHNLYFSDMSFHEKVLTTIPEYIKKVTIKNKVIDFQTLNFDQKESVIYKFPASLKQEIQNAVLENIKILASCDIFEISYFKEQKFNFYNLIYIEIIKLFFSQNAKRIYEEIYILSNFNMSSEYVLNMSPSERKVYISFIEAQKKSQDPSPMSEGMQVPTHQGNRTVDDLAVEFGDMPSN